MADRRVLLITYPWPPMPTVGINRWTAQRRHLEPLGVQLDVLTTAAFGRLSDDAANRVIRAGDLSGSPRLRRMLGRPKLLADRAGTAVHTPAPEHLASLVPPDIYALSWGPAALAAALRAVRRRRPDAVVSTAPYESAHLVALAVSRLTGTPWIADFRDGWNFEPHRPPFRFRTQARIDAAMELAVTRGADVVIAATVPIAEDFRRRLGISAVHVPNAWDPALEAELDPAAAPPLNQSKLSLVHTGGLGSGWSRSARHFLEGLELVVREDAQLADRLEVVLAGPVDADERVMLASPPLRGIVRAVGPLSRGGAMALQRASDALLLVTARKVGEATGKLFEYLGAGRPILALAEGNEACRIITATATGVCVAPDDPVSIGRGVRDLVDGRVAAEFDPHDLEPYVQPGPAKAVAQQIEYAISRAR